MIKKEKIEDLKQSMIELDIHEKDLIEKFLTGTGKGGQKINTTHHCVYLKHLPTSIEVKCQKTRSREDNRFFARRALCEKITQLFYPEKSIKLNQYKKIRKQKKRRKMKNKQKTDLSEKKI